MKKLLIACLATASLVSLSACSTVNEQKAPSTRSTVDSGPQSLVPYPGTTIITTDPQQLPKPADNP